MFERNHFLKSHHISEDEFQKTQLDWAALEAIATDHEMRSAQQKAVGDFVLQVLRTVPTVHSLKMRIKSRSSLVEKIIRKKLEDPAREITFDNYTDNITDLIGIRAMHLFKDDWQPIHTFVTDTFGLKERPTAYVRTGGQPTVVELFTAADCEIKEHPRGYRSVHYLLQCQPAKKPHIVELQVRTIFEEGWSEIDHRIGYEPHSANPVLAHFLTIFNRLAGSADEMGTFIKGLSKYIEDSDAHSAQLKEQLDDTIGKLKITEDEKEKLQKLYEEQRKLSKPPITFAGINADKLGSHQALVFKTSPIDVSALTAATAALGIDFARSAVGPENYLKAMSALLCAKCRQPFFNPGSDLCPACSRGSGGSFK